MTTSIQSLMPSPIARTRWVRVTEFPKHNRIGRYSVIVDRAYTQDGAPHSVKVVYAPDHPVLVILNAMPHVPRATKSIYRGPKRLAFACATDVWWVFKEIDAGFEAFETYLRNLDTTRPNH